MTRLTLGNILVIDDNRNHQSFQNDKASTLVAQHYGCMIFLCPRHISWESSQTLNRYYRHSLATPVDEGCFQRLVFGGKKLIYNTFYLVKIEVSHIKTKIIFCKDVLECIS